MEQVERAAEDLARDPSRRGELAELRQRLSSLLRRLPSAGGGGGTRSASDAAAAPPWTAALDERLRRKSVASAASEAFASRPASRPASRASRRPSLAPPPLDDDALSECGDDRGPIPALSEAQAAALAAQGAGQRAWRALAAVLPSVPALSWAPRYSGERLSGDLVAGLTVGLMLVPQALAYASVAGLPPVYGLYSSVVGVLVYCLLGTADFVSVGPTAIMSLLVSTAAHPVDGAVPVAHAVALSLVAGCLQAAMGLLRLGMVVEYISYPTISGFTSAAAILIAAHQVRHLLGIHGVRRELYYLVGDVGRRLGDARAWDTAVGLVCLAVLLLMARARSRLESAAARTRLLREEADAERHLAASSRRMSATASSPLLPATPAPPPREAGATGGPATSSKGGGGGGGGVTWLWVLLTGRGALVVVLATAGAYLAHVGGAEPMLLVGHVPSGLPSVAVPSLPSGWIHTYWSSALAVALVGFLESVAVAKAFAREGGYVVRPSQELFALGACNAAGSFVSAFPVTGSFTRTAVTARSGGRTPLSGVFAGVVVVIALLVATPAFAYIPKTSLAALIMAATFGMVDFRLFADLFRLSRSESSARLELLALVVSFLGTLLVSVAFGVLSATGCAVVGVLYRRARPALSYHVVVVPPAAAETVAAAAADGHGGAVASPGAEAAAEAYGRLEDAVVVRIRGDLDFSSVAYVSAFLDSVVRGLYPVPAAAGGTPTVAPVPLMRDGRQQQQQQRRQASGKGQGHGGAVVPAPAPAPPRTRLERQSSAALWGTLGRGRGRGAAAAAAAAARQAAPVWVRLYASLLYTNPRLSFRYSERRGRHSMLGTVVLDLRECADMDFSGLRELCDAYDGLLSSGVLLLLLGACSRVRVFLRAAGFPRRAGQALPPALAARGQAPAGVPQADGADSYQHRRQERAATLAGGNVTSSDSDSDNGGFGGVDDLDDDDNDDVNGGSGRRGARERDGAAVYSRNLRVFHATLESAMETAHAFTHQRQAYMAAESLLPARAADGAAGRRRGVSVAVRPLPGQL